MHAPITYSGFDGARSLLEERPMSPPIIGRIRPGIKVLTRKARENPEAVRIHDAMLAQGHSFESIGIQIERKTQLRNALVPKNVPWFTCRGSDFANPDVADDIMQRYGEDRGDGNGLKLWRFPVVFAFDDWRRAWLAGDPAVQATMEMRAAVYDGLWEAAYSLLLFGIIIGSSFFAAILLRLPDTLSRVVGGLYALAAIQSVLLQSGELGGPVLPESLAYWVYPATQPLARILIGLWLLRVARQGEPRLEGAA